MPDDLSIPPQLILNHPVGDIIPFNDVILDDAVRAFHCLKEGWQKMRSLRDLYNLCHAAGQVDKYLEITKEARTMPELVPFKTDVLFFAGSICEDDRRYDQALEYYLRCLEFDTDTEWIRYNRAVNAAFCYLMKGDPFKAKEHCEAAIIIDPDEWLAWKNLGMAFEALDNAREAARCYVRAIRLSNGNIGPVIYLRELVKRCADQIKDLDKVREELVKKGVLV